jgi:hypothetical protein
LLLLKVSYHLLEPLLVAKNLSGLKFFHYTKSSWILILEYHKSYLDVFWFTEISLGTYQRYASHLNSVILLVYLKGFEGLVLAQKIDHLGIQT